MSRSLILAIAFTAVFSAVLAQNCLPDNERQDCHPESGSSEVNCLAKNCTWCPSSGGSQYPWCFFPGKEAGLGYRVQGEPVQTANGFKLSLARIEGSRSRFGNARDADLLDFEVDNQSNNRLRIKIRDVNPRFEVPLQVDAPTGGNASPLYDVEYTSEPVFSFRVVRKSNKAVLFDSSQGVLAFADQYIEFTTKLPSKNLYGIGENEQPSFRHNFDASRTWALWAKDQPPAGDANMYGVHPHYTVVENDGNTHAVAIVNANAQQFSVGSSNGEPTLNYKTIGGILDFYFFLGPTPEEVVQQYTQAVGRYPLPSYWSLGFQLCRYGYNQLATMQEVVDRTKAAKIPQDVQYGDIDIMDRQLDFTYSPDRFGGLPAYVKQLKTQGVKFVTILDPAISTGEPRGSYPAYDRGEAADVWIKRADGSNAVGKVWPDAPCHFPDYSKAATRTYWTTLVKEFHDLIEYDGLWIDMNEPANFNRGDTERGCESNLLNNPPYLPNIRGGNLAEMTLCPDHVSAAGTHYDTHSLYGWFQSEPTRNGALAARPGKRAVVLSRSTFLGSGRWVAHWLGDNYSQWSNLHFSIIGMLQFNQFGIPFTGSDICGFNGDAQEQMCQRWQQLGAFYPFSRNHNVINTRAQDPAVWSKEVAESSRVALEIRYELLPFLYTLFYDHVTVGGTVVRALWHEFATDAVALGVDTQFLWGQSFMISAVVLEGATSRDVYFPDARWYSYYDGKEVTSRGQTATLQVPMDFIPLHFRGGFVFPTQPLNGALNTEASRLNPFALTVTLDDNDEATGHLYYDDGDSVDSLDTGRYSLIRYKFANGELEQVVEHDGYPRMSELRLDSIRIMGAKNVSRAIVNSHRYAPLLKSAAGEVKIFNLNLKMNEPFKIKIQ